MDRLYCAIFHFSVIVRGISCVKTFDTTGGLILRGKLRATRVLIRVYNFNGARRNGTTILADLINPRGSISCVVTSNAALDASL